MRFMRRDIRLVGQLLCEQRSYPLPELQKIPTVVSSQLSWAKDLWSIGGKSISLPEDSKWCPAGSTVSCEQKEHPHYLSLAKSEQEKHPHFLRIFNFSTPTPVVTVVTNISYDPHYLRLAKIYQPAFATNCVLLYNLPEIRFWSNFAQFPPIRQSNILCQRS